MKQLNWADGRKFGVKQYDSAPAKAKKIMDKLVGAGKKTGWIQHCGRFVYVVLGMNSRGIWEAQPWVSLPSRPVLGGVC